MNTQTVKQSITAAILALILIGIGAFVLLMPAWSASGDAERNLAVLEREAARDVNPLAAIPPRSSARESADQIRRLAPAQVTVAKIRSGPARPAGALMHTDHVVSVKGPAGAIGEFIGALHDAIVMEAGVPRGTPRARLWSVVASDLAVDAKGVASGSLTVRSYTRRAQDAPITAP